jgi:hypothetical protein
MLIAKVSRSGLGPNPHPRSALSFRRARHWWREQLAAPRARSIQTNRSISSPSTIPRDTLRGP